MLITKTDTHTSIQKRRRHRQTIYKNPSHPRSSESGEIGARGLHKYDLEDQLAGHIQISIAFKKPPSTGRQKKDDTKTHNPPPMVDGVVFSENHFFDSKKMSAGASDVGRGDVYDENLEIASLKPESSLGLRNAQLVSSLQKSDTKAIQNYMQEDLRHTRWTMQDLHRAHAINI